MSVLHFRHPNTYSKSPPPLKKPKLFSDDPVPFAPPQPDLACHETLDTPQESSWRLSDPDYPIDLTRRWGGMVSNPDLILASHLELTPHSRAQLIDWMSSVCHEFSMKRETLYTAVLLVDHYLLKSREVLRQKFQLVGLAAIYVGSKFEETAVPRLEEMVSASGFTFSQKELEKMERVILVTCQWHVFISTIQHWMSWGMDQWDRYLSLTSPHDRNLFLFQSVYSYDLYRTLTQTLDCVLLDIQYHQFPEKTLVAAGFFCFLGKRYRNQEQFQALFHKFASDAFLIGDFSEMREATAYVERFANMEKTKEITEEEMGLIKDYPAFLSVHQHNCAGLDFYQRSISSTR